MADVTVDRLKEVLAENCMIKSDLSEIDADTPLFGPGSVGLDSIDALQLTVAVEKEFGVPIRDPQTARAVLSSLGALQQWLARQE